MQHNVAEAQHPSARLEPAASVVFAGLAPVFADPALGGEAIVKALLEIGTVLIGFGGRCSCPGQLSRDR
jgi:hypothetical protein